MSTTSTTDSRAPRRIAVDVAAVLLCIVLPLAMVSSWVAGVVTDTDRYVATVGPLAADAKVKAAVETQLNGLVLDAIDLPRQRAAIVSYLEARGISRQLTARAQPLATLLENLVEDTVAKAVHHVVDSEQFAQAWRAANRSAHEQLVAVLRSESAVVDDSGRVSIRLATLVNAVVGVLGSSLPVTITKIPDVEASFPLIKTSDLEHARLGFRVLDAVGFWLPVLWLIGFAAAVGFAPSRRRTLRFLGYGGVIALVLLAVALAIARHVTLGALPAADRDLVDAVWHHLFARLYAAVRIGLVVAAGLLVVQWLGGEGRRPVAVRAAARSSVATLRRTEWATFRTVSVLVGIIAVVWVLR